MDFTFLVSVEMIFKIYGLGFWDIQNPHPNVIYITSGWGYTYFLALDPKFGSKV